MDIFSSPSDQRKPTFDLPEDTHTIQRVEIHGLRHYEVKDEHDNIVGARVEYRKVTVIGVRHILWVQN